jgi:A/G-specific adenine glycosylase
MKKITSAEIEFVDAQFSCDNLMEEGKHAFRQHILSYYSRYGRHEMMWRHTTNPYHILVSELMLQQTQVERVAIKFPQFIAAFPDFSALAAAPLGQVLSSWQGMGYNRRAIALKQCAEKVQNEYGGILPDDIDVLKTFPGIGPATAASICAFAFNAPVVFMETNIRRVFIHFFFSDSPFVTDNDILPLVRETLDVSNPRTWYWALMDAGAALKKSVPNPNRKSATYSRQKPFEGSDRKIRGIILKMLVTHQELEEEELSNAVPEAPERVSRIISALEAEGFIVQEKNHYRIAD